MIEYNDNIMEFVEDFDKLRGTENKFKYYFLYHSLNSVLYDSVSYYDAWIYRKNDTWIVGLWVDGHYFFYGQNWKKIDVKKIVDRIDFSIFQNGFHFVGEFKLVKEIFNINKLETIDFKNRYFYQLVSKNDLKTDFAFEIEQPKESDISKLAKMYKDYFQEEYKGTNNKTLKETSDSIKNMIDKKNIFINRLDGKISGFCTTMFTNSPEPLIGTLFVKKEFRNQKIGKSLLGKTTKKLLENKDTCYLMTEMENKPSNKVVEEIGFTNIYKHTDKVITGANTV